MPTARKSCRLRPRPEKETAESFQRGGGDRTGNLYFDADQYEKSIQAYRKALELKPDNADVWTDMGVMYRKAGRSDEAVKAFDQATAVNPKHEVSRLNKGIVPLHDLQDPAGAIRAWEGLLKSTPWPHFRAACPWIK